jgi:hypothetical protein
VAEMRIKSLKKSESKRKLSMALTQTLKLIEECKRSEVLRLNEKAFRRERKLGASKMLHILLRKICSSLQLCLDSYFESIEESTVSKQAFSKARKQMNPEYVRGFADMTSKIAADDETKSTYNGMYLIAIDGSDVALENTAELKESFGCSGGKNNSATGSYSIAFDPLNHAIYDCRIGRYRTDERDFAKEHVILILFRKGFILRT